MLKILFFFNDLVTSRQVKKERRFFKLRRALCVFILKTVGTGRLKKKNNKNLRTWNLKIVDTMASGGVIPVRVAIRIRPLSGKERQEGTQVF